MKLRELLVQPDLLETEFRQYQRPRQPYGMPPLDLTRLEIKGVLDGQISVPTEGGHTLVVRYKGKNGGVVSASESECGNEWSILQVQGAKSGKSFRVASCLEWQRCLADRYNTMSLDERAEVERITMPDLFGITNLTSAENYEGAQRSYGIVRQALRMRHSDEERQWVRDVTRGKAAHILSPASLDACYENNPR